MSVEEVMNTAWQEIKKSGFSKNTEKAYLDWIYRFLLFHHDHPPENLNEQDISTFLSFYALRKQAYSSTQNQALHALLFLFRNVFKKDVKHIDYIRLKRHLELPEIFSREEIRRILSQLSDEKKMIISLLYGCGLTLSECLSLRIRDIDTGRNVLIVHNPRNSIIREIQIPLILRNEIETRINELRYRYMHLMLGNYHGVTLPERIANMEPEAEKSFSWFYFFPTLKPVKEGKEIPGLFHHRSETYVQKAVRKALKESGIRKNASCHAFRHSYATHLLEDGKDIHELQKLLGHSNIRNTLIYKNILKFNTRISGSPLDKL